MRYFPPSFVIETWVIIEVTIWGDIDTAAAPEHAGK
jgi:hypothetical protein